MNSFSIQRQNFTDKIRNNFLVFFYQFSLTVQLFTNILLKFQDENAGKKKKKEEDDEFLSEIRSFVSSVAAMTTKSNQNAMELKRLVSFLNCFKFG